MKKYMLLPILLINLILVEGCQTAPTLSADQLNAIPNGTVFCTTITGPYGTGKVTVIKLDQAVVPVGSVQVDSNTCGATITNIQVQQAAGVPLMLVPAQR